MNKGTCSFDDCGRPLVRRGLCNGHLQQKYKGIPLKPLKWRPAPGVLCLFEACNREAETKALCSGHYQQRMAGKPLKPLRRRHVPGSVCEFETCDNLVAKIGRFCDGHYCQYRLGKPLLPLRRHRGAPRRRGRGALRDHLGRKLCHTCGKWLAPVDFAKNRKAEDGLANGCKTCYGHSNTAWRYGITVEKYLELRAAQDCKCAICGEPEDLGVRRMSLDHDHSCCSKIPTCGKCVRGLLCNSCNAALGYLRDNPEAMRAAASYVERYRAT